MTVVLWEERVTYKTENLARIGISEYDNKYRAVFTGWNGVEHVTIASRICKTLAGAKRACTTWMKECAKFESHIEWIQLK